MAELFDVIVVAARGAGRAVVAELAQTIATRYGLNPGAVALGLDRGGIEIHRGLLKNEAVGAAHVLHDLGAVSELRAARDVSGVLTIEPDAEAPTSVSAFAPEPEPSLPPAPPFGVSATSRPASAPAPPTASSPEPRSSTSTPRAPIEDAAPAIDPDAPTISAAALGGTPVAGRFAPPEASERIELDLAAAGLAHAPAGTSALARNRGSDAKIPQAEASGPRPIVAREPALPEAATSGRYPSESMRAATSVRAPAAFVDDAPPAGLLAADRVLSILAAATIGAVVGIIVAFGWTRSAATEASTRLETELQASVADPIGVEEGRARSTDAIVKELDKALDEQRSRFLLVWAVVAIPIGALGAIPRR